jgi:hypothetical protein
MGITTDLESDLIEVMLCCDLGQINSILNQNGTFLDLIFSDITVEICESPLLGLYRYHKAYELLVVVRLCEFETTSMDERRFKFRVADCEAITDETKNVMGFLMTIIVLALRRRLRVFLGMLILRKNVLVIHLS